MLPVLVVTALGLLAVPLAVLSSLGPLFALPAVAGVAAWGLERIGAWSPPAAPRALGGALLGAGLGLFVTVHMRAPYAAVLAGPAAATLLAALFFEALGRLRWPEPHPPQADPPASSNVESAQRASKKS
jgi:hypothetical protein